MTVTFFYIKLNHHEVSVADALYDKLGSDFKFIELCDDIKDGGKGSNEDFSKRPYLLRAWESEEKKQEAMSLAISSDVAFFVGYKSLKYQIKRLKWNKLSFEVSERWLKRGKIGILSPYLLKVFLNYHFRRWHTKNLYKLCSSAFAERDHAWLGMYKGKCYKWGYITKVEKLDVEASSDVSTSNIAPLMWCSRYLMWKHPELPILLAERLKQRGYKFHLNMYGDGTYRKKTEEMVNSLGLSDVVSIRGNVPNDQVREAMRRSDIFLFTSDRYEGWGAVANESLSCGCALVASDAIGSSPYLIEEGVNGFMFRSAKTGSSFENPDEVALDDLTCKVSYLLDNRKQLNEMKQKAVEMMQSYWSPEHAAESLLQLIDDLKNGRDSSIKVGPCSKA